MKQALAANGTYPFEPARPWERCFDVAITGQQWLMHWQDEVMVPSLTMLTQATGVGHYLTGDADVASSSSAHLATRYSTEADPTPASGRSGGKGGDRKRPAPTGGGTQPKHVKVKEEAPRQHNVSANGLLTSNRKGRSLCAGYQTGACTGVLCPKGNAHQCEKCLGPRHGSSHPHPCQYSSKPPPQNKGNGKKGSKKGGK